MTQLINIKTVKVKSTKRRSTKVELAKITGIVTFQPVDPQPAISFTLTPLDPLDPEYDEFVQFSKPDLDRSPFTKARLFEHVNQDSRVLVSMLTVIKVPCLRPLRCLWVKMKYDSSYTKRFSVRTVPSSNHYASRNGWTIMII
jgi:hypothetical protein